MIAALIVAYRPQAESFVPLLERMPPQVDLVVVVDNSAPHDEIAWRLALDSGIALDRLRFVRLGRNAGVGAALNVAAEIAAGEGATAFLLSDQDSLPAPDMVGELAALLPTLGSAEEPVAAVGPTYTDMYTERAYPFQVQEPGRLFYTHGFPPPGESLEVLALITSGSLIPRDVFFAVGPMDEGLFIDYVDVEWCFRARERGYRLYGSDRARMFQRMGDASLRVWYLRWRQETRYPPLRIYYRVRNHIALVKRGYVPLGWKLRSSWFIAGVVYSHALFGDRRLESLRMALRGLWDGLLGRLGPAAG
jgi:rhamnosyltransferase